MQSFREWSWSQSEKQIARRAFDRALHEEKEAAIREFKERVERIRSIEDIDDLWALEDWLRRRRRAIDEKFDYRYSVLPEVFARLLFDGAIEESDLAGLAKEKVDEIRRIASIYRSFAERK
jgi:hypothetical protein